MMMMMTTTILLDLSKVGMYEVVKNPRLEIVISTRILRTSTHQIMKMTLLDYATLSSVSFPVSMYCKKLGSTFRNVGKMKLTQQSVCESF